MTHYPSKPLFNSSESESQTPIMEYDNMKKYIFADVLLLIFNIVCVVFNLMLGNNIMDVINSFTAGVLFMSIIALSTMRN